MSDTITIDTNVLCAGCGKPVQCKQKNTKVEEKWVVNLRIDWREHALCAAAFLKNRGNA